MVVAPFKAIGGFDFNGDGIYFVAAVTNASNVNQLIVYYYNGSTWTQTPTTVTFPILDTSIASTKSTGAGTDVVVVGAPTATASGEVYVYTRTGSTITLQATLSQAGSSGFGTSVDINSTGTTIVVGAPGTSTNDGRVYVYQGSGASWSLSATLNTSTVYSGQNLGKSVSISPDGGTIVAGAPVTPLGGRVAIWTLSSGSWVAGPIFDGPSPGASFGWDVDCSSTQFVAGAPGKNATYTYSNATGTWQFVDADFGDITTSYGQSLVLTNDANILLVGAPLY